LSLSFRILNLDTAAYIGDVIDFTSVKASFEYSGVGALNIEQPLTGRFANLLTTDVEVVAYWNNTEIRNGRWVVRGKQGETVDDSGGRVGLGGLSWADVLRKVVVYADTTFTAQTPGAIIRTLLQTATTRGAFGAANTTTSTFSNTLDSKGVAWANSLTITYQAGATYRQILESLADRGLIDFEFAGRDLMMYNGTTMGTTKDVVLAAGRHVKETPFKESTENKVNYVLVEGDNGLLTERFVSGPRREESFQSQSGIKDAGTLAVLGDSYLTSASITKSQRTTKIASASLVQPFQDFNVGDSIIYDDGSGPQTMRVRQITVEIDNDGRMETSLILNDRILEDEIVRAKTLTALAGGVTSGTVGAPETDVVTDTTIPKAPASATASSSAYVDQTNGRSYAQATVTWPAVTQNTDNTAIDDLHAYEVKYRTDTATPATTPTSLAPATRYDTLTARFDRRGKTYGWTTGIMHGSCRAGGRDWFDFADTRIGTANALGVFTTTAHLVRNSMVLLDPTNNASWDARWGKANMLTANDASLEAAIGTWRADSNCSVSRITSTAKHGTASLQVTVTAAGDAVATTGLGSASGWYAVTAATQYTVHAYARETSGTAKNYTVGIRWWNASGTLISTTESSSMAGTQSGSGAHRRLAATFTSPALAVRAAIVVRVVAGTLSQTHSIDCAGLYLGDNMMSSWSLPGTGSHVALITPEEVNLATSNYLRAETMWTSGGKVYAMYSLWPAATSIYIARWDATTFAFEWFAAFRTSETVVWGRTSWENATYSYIYGSTTAAPTSMFLMRVPVGNPLGTQEFWTGAAWSVTRASAAAVSSLNKGLSSLTQIGASYWGITISANNQIRLYTSAALESGWSEVGLVAYMSEVNGTTVVASDAKIHRQFDSADGIVMSYSADGTINGLQKTRYMVPKFLRGPKGSVTAPTPITPSSATITIEAGTLVAYVSGLQVNGNFVASVRAVDNSGNASGWTDSNVIRLADDTTPPPAPSMPQVASQFQGIRVEWDGTDLNGNTMPADWFATEVHVSEDNDFQPSMYTRVDTFYSPSGAVSSVQGLDFNTTYYVKLVAYDVKLNSSDASTQTSTATIQLSDPDLPNKLITAAKIADGTITTTQINVAAFGENMVPNGGFEDLDSNGFPAHWQAGYTQGGGGPSQLSSDTASIAGNRAMKSIVTATDAVEIVQTDILSLVPGDIYYVSAWVRTSATLSSANLLVRFWSAETEAKVGAIFDSQSVITNIGTTTAGTTAVKVEGQVVVPALHKYGRVAIYPQITGTGYTAWVDEVQVRRVVGTANIANASINNAKIASLAVDNAQIANVSAGKITVGTLNADITVSARIKTADTGNRVEMSNSGIYGFKDSGANHSFKLQTDGTFWASGTIASSIITGSTAYFPDSNASAPGYTQISGDGFYLYNAGTTNLLSNPAAETSAGYVASSGVTVQTKGAIVPDISQNLDAVAMYGKTALKIYNTGGTGYVDVPIAVTLSANTQYSYSFHVAVSTVLDISPGTSAVGYARFQDMGIVEKFQGGGSRMLTTGVDTKIVLDGAYMGKYTSANSTMPNNSSHNQIGVPDWVHRWGKTFTTPGDVSGTSTYWLRLPVARTVFDGNEGTLALVYDGMQVEQKSFITRYCDGDQTGCSWNGTAHASTSTRPDGLGTIWFPSYGEPIIKGRIRAPDIVVTNSFKQGSGAAAGTNYIEYTRSSTLSVPNATWTLFTPDTVITTRTVADDGTIVSGANHVSQVNGLYALMTQVVFTSSAGPFRAARWLTQGSSLICLGTTDPGFNMAQVSGFVTLPGAGYFVVTHIYQGSGGALTTFAHANANPAKTVFALLK